MSVKHLCSAKIIYVYTWRKECSDYPLANLQLQHPHCRRRRLLWVDFKETFSKYPKSLSSFVPSHSNANFDSLFLIKLQWHLAQQCPCSLAGGRLAYGGWDEWATNEEEVLWKIEFLPRHVVNKPIRLIVSPRGWLLHRMERRPDIGTDLRVTHRNSLAAFSDYSFTRAEWQEN